MTDIPSDVMAKAMALSRECESLPTWPETYEAIALALLTERREAEQRGIERAAKVCSDEAADPRNADAPNYRMGCMACAAGIRALPTTADTGKEA